MSGSSFARRLERTPYENVWDQLGIKKPRTDIGVMDGILQSRGCLSFYHPDCCRRHLNFTGSAPLSRSSRALPPVEEFHLAPKNTSTTIH